MRHTHILSLILSVATFAAMAAEPAVGSAAPEFGGTKFYNAPVAGAPVTLASLRGRVVLLDFWATWCGPCVASIPHLIELHEKYHDKGLAIVGHTDGSSTDVDGFIKTKAIPYIISVGPDIGDAYGVKGIPHVFLIDPDGQIAWHGHPASLDEKTVIEQLKRVHLAPSPTPSFAKPAAIDKVAKIESSIALGKVGAGLKTLEKLANDKDSATASSAKNSIQIISTWKTGVDAELAKLRTAGDVYAAAELASALATSFAGHDDAKEFLGIATELKKDPGYLAGKEYQKLTAIPNEARKDQRFTKMVDAFLKKYDSGYYADQAKLLTK